MFAFFPPNTGKSKSNPGKQCFANLNDARCQENEIGIETIETAMTLTTNLTPTQCFQKLLPVQN